MLRFQFRNEHLCQVDPYSVTKAPRSDDIFTPKGMPESVDLPVGFCGSTCTVYGAVLRCDALPQNLSPPRALVTGGRNQSRRVARRPAGV